MEWKEFKQKFHIEIQNVRLPTRMALNVEHWMQCWWFRITALIRIIFLNTSWIIDGWAIQSFVYWYASYRTETVQIMIFFFIYISLFASSFCCSATHTSFLSTLFFFLFFSRLIIISTKITSIEINRVIN